MCMSVYKSLVVFILFGSSTAFYAKDFISWTWNPPSRRCYVPPKT